jgi:hypothetical protein
LSPNPKFFSKCGMRIKLKVKGQEMLCTCTLLSESSGNTGTVLVKWWFGLWFLVCESKGNIRMSSD